MSFNYDLMTWVDYFVGAFVCCFGGFFIGKILTSKKVESKVIYKYLLLVVLSIFSIFNYIIFNSIAKIFGSLLMAYIICKVVLKETSVNSFFYSIWIYIMLILSETTVSISFVIIQFLFKINLLENFVHSIFINFLIVAIACIYAKLLKNKVNNITNKISRSSVFYTIIIGIIIIFVTISLLYNLYLNGWKLDYKFILNTIIIVGFLVINIVIIKQYLGNKEITDKYNLLQDYLKTSAELIEKYSTTVHKYKNNLIAIKGYFKYDMKEAEIYIDNLLGDYNNRKYNWINKINNIKIDSIRYLVYYKLSKAENANLKITVDVSKNVNMFVNDLLNIKESNILLEIIGELFDNAIYASEESNNKELNYSMFEQDGKLHIMLANTYKNTINLALITKNGWTTKGENHGLGLYDIDKTIRKNNWIKVNYELIDNYFVANLVLDLNRKK